LLRSGELEQIATPREIYSRPATAYVAQFIGHTNLLKGEVRGGIAHCGFLSWPTTIPNGPAIFSLRPENILLATASSAISGAIRIRGKVQSQAFHGATELIRVECPDGLTLVVRTPANAQTLDEVELTFDPADAVPVRESPERT
jgi:putative spermidine/putrescine transport system ATP-binding protein